MLTLLPEVRDCAAHRAVPARAEALGNAGANCAVACCLATVRLASAGAQQDATTAARDVEQQVSTGLVPLQREMLARCMAFTQRTTAARPKTRDEVRERRWYSGM